MSKSYVKLKNVGDTATFTVVRCAPGNGKYPDVEFEDADGKVYPVPKASADKQLARLGIVDESDVVGRAITISRSENKQDATKNYWNIDFAANGNGSGPASAGKAGASNSGGGVATPLPHRPPTQPAAPAAKEKDSALYVRMTQFVLDEIAPIYKAKGIILTPEAAVAATATLYIQAKR